LDFTEYDFNQEFTINNRYQDASITNLFYWGNIVHDVSYIYGFDEAAGNFQHNNYDRGGLENDSMEIIGQYEIDFCNAAFINFSDGNSSYIRMNACGTKDGSFDNLVLIHEYAHGISLRLTGGGQYGGCFSNEEGIGEGIADWYGLMFTLSPNDIGTTSRGYATYLFNDGPNGDGIRPYPYTTDMNINPLTYDSIKEYNALHQVGSVWGTILWDLTWKLIDEYGFDRNIYNFTGDKNKDAGNIKALAIVTEALKLQSCFSGFVDARNAIFYANQVIYGGYDECILWEVFARRGLGESAYQGSSNSFLDGIESFDNPSKIAKFDFNLDNICANSETISNLRGGSPIGGIYSGLGVIYEGNGRTFYFDPEKAGIGNHTIIYEVPDSRCSNSSFSERAIAVIIDEISPEIFCFNDITVTIPIDEEFYEIIDFSDRIQINDNCYSLPTISQQPVAGIPLGVGTVNMSMKATDIAGNEVVCNFKITVEKEVEEGGEILEIYPNPVRNEINLSSYKEIEFLTTYIFDINGRIIQSRQFNYFGFENKLDVENLSPGMYFLKIESERVNVVKRIIKL
jgi:extracellular elastinolytic metalloproteinase